MHPGNSLPGRWAGLALGAVILLADGAAIADSPPSVLPVTVCSLSDAVCVTRGAGGATVWRRLPGGRRRPLWRAAIGAGALQVADDGRSLVEVQPQGNLADLAVGPGTVMLAFFAPGRAPVRVTLGQMIRDVAHLPRTVSHRLWAYTLGYDGRGHFQVDTVEGRRILFDPATGRPAAR